MENSYYYLIQIGSKEFSLFGHYDDRIVRRIAVRWISLFWEKYKQQIKRNYPGLIRESIDFGRYNPPKVKIGRLFCENGIVPCKRFTIIEDFPITEDSLREFKRVYR